MWLDVIRCVYIYIYICILYISCIYIYICIEMCIIYIHIHTYMCVYMCLYIMCVHTHVCNKCMYIFCKCVEYTCTFMREFNSETGYHQWWVRGQWLVHVTYTEWTAVVGHGSTVLGVFTNLFHEIPIIPMIFPALTTVNHRMVVPQSSSKSWMTMT
jgi:hypothetical protein